ncbi:cholinesterase 1 [Eurytemora carolleeae]|uniref:cholinesterase 1 n=1 Tax=Eurytemora carolleeae TaxID=1294199 RepID=UPI000C7848F1|nr:cholinesterase 1 [Eurytemora carolleeae]|eukprot:XP_023323487.1 cholinesterase 1-like [Eurytemora affinis]
MLFYIMLLFLLPGLLLLLRRVLGKRLLPKIGLPPPVVSTKNGQVMGSWSYSGKGNRMFANFQGIPYAKPPLGKLRFLRPEPVENWEGVKVCTKSIEFVQKNIFKKGTPSIGNENALVLNIYSPNLKGNFPVLVFIHGGGFTSGSNSSMLYGGEHFMDKEVVLVAINYRLSVLGGLFLDGDKVPGNQGMRDQVLALRWIQDNIGPFGGDKDRVTIFGESAGGMSVMNHILSPMSAGLFSAAISQSGDSTSPFCCSSKHPAHYGYKLVEKLGINPKAPIDEILLQLQRRDAHEIQDQGYMFEEFVRAPLPFKPIVDGGLVPDPFLPEEPMDLLRKGKFNKVPFITGTNKDEGLLLKAFYLAAPGGKSNFKTAWDKFNTIGPLAFFAKERDEVTAEESKACENYKKKYFGETPFSHQGRGAEGLVKMYGDMLFAAPTDRTSR